MIRRGGYNFQFYQITPYEGKHLYELVALCADRDEARVGFGAECGVITSPAAVVSELNCKAPSALCKRHCSNIIAADRYVRSGYLVWKEI